MDNPSNPGLDVSHNPEIAASTVSCSILSNNASDLTANLFMDGPAGNFDFSFDKLSGVNSATPDDDNEPNAFLVYPLFIFYYQLYNF